MPRYFNLVEAESLLPEVEGLLRSLIQLKADYERTDAELQSLLQRISVSGGMVPPREKIGQLKTRKDASARGLQSSVKRIEESGCQLKDVQIGLIDFPTLYHDREVYLCWKLGESGIGYWHHVEDGVRGRHAIDSEFLANHRGER